MKTLGLLTTLLVSFASPQVFAGQGRMFIPAGTNILVRADETIDSKRADEGRIYPGTIDQDVLDQHGRVAVRRGARAELMVRRVESGKDLVLDLQSIQINGRRYFVNADDFETMQKRKGVGKNKRTAEMVGGGTIFGTILGAIAGGGAGAAIGAVSGAAGGGLLQTFTRGKHVRVPAEAVLTFRLERPLFLYPVQ
ncbi:MAG TPA: hypothetical protein VE621_13100 [Bryobacteraceae bacterium]|nr:hypothetical protein [Bryobacteraceae bacterium]